MKTSAQTLTATLFYPLKYKLTPAIKTNWLCDCCLTLMQSVCFFGLFSLVQIAREAEAAMFHRQMFEELRRISHLTRDPTESVAIGAVEASFKCCATAIIVLTKSGRWDLIQKSNPVNFLCSFLSHISTVANVSKETAWSTITSLYPSASIPSFTQALGSYEVCQLSWHSQSVLYLWPFEIWTLTFSKLILTPCSFLLIWEFVLTTHNTEDVLLSAGWIC